MDRWIRGWIDIDIDIDIGIDIDKWCGYIYNMYVYIYIYIVYIHTCILSRLAQVLRFRHTHTCTPVMYACVHI